MSQPLLPADRTRLAQLCGMLGSAFEGERASAARLATELLKSRGLTWAELVVPESEVRDSITAPPTRDDALRCADHPEILTAWEFAFVASLAKRRKPFTKKQADVLAAIVAKVDEATGGRP